MNTDEPEDPPEGSTLGPDEQFATKPRQQPPWLTAFWEEMDRRERIIRSGAEPQDEGFA